MKISLICFSLSGRTVMDRLKEALEKEGNQVEAASKSKYLPDSLEIPLKDWCRAQFETAHGVVFIGAAGIAVRTIASFVASKKTDPAVVVVDELGTYAISLLSGHLGGANELAQTCARILGAQPVITTATDLNGRFAVDVFAKKNSLAIHNMTAAKEVSAALLKGEPVGLFSDFPVEGELPEGLVLCGADGIPVKADWTGEEQTDGRIPGALAVGIAVTTARECRPFSSTVTLVPRVMILGMGCRKGKEESAIEQAVEELLVRHHLHRDCLKCVASVDLKAEEKGILEFCESRKLPFLTFTAEELEAVPGTFTPSGFVRKTVGVDNVCERSAKKAGGETWIEKKRGADGITTALMQEDWRIKF